MRRFATVTVTLLVWLWCMAGCDSPQSKVPGKWQVENTDMVWEFHRNGSAVSGTRKGKWTFGDNNRLKIQTQMATFVYEVEFPTRDRMIWREGTGTRTELRRLE